MDIFVAFDLLYRETAHDALVAINSIGMACNFLHGILCMVLLYGEGSLCEAELGFMFNGTHPSKSQPLSHFLHSSLCLFEVWSVFLRA